jgi:hypothetical protein
MRFIERQTGGRTSSIIIAGAVGDYGTVVSTDKNGKPDLDGSYSKITLKKGTFDANATALTAKLNAASFPINESSCSSWGSVTAPVTLFGGTRLYRGISGTVRVTETLAWVLTRYTSGAQTGQCDGHNVAKMVVSVSGLGKVRF